MTHRALLSEVWGPAWSEDTATLRTHVANLRRKVEPPTGPKLIRTDPGIGYRIDALVLGADLLRRRLRAGLLRG